MFKLRVGKDVHKTKQEALDYVFKTHMDLAKKYARKSSDCEAVALDALRQLRELDDEAEKSE